MAESNAEGAPPSDPPATSPEESKSFNRAVSFNQEPPEEMSSGLRSLRSPTNDRGRVDSVAAQRGSMTDSRVSFFDSSRRGINDRDNFFSAPTQEAYNNLLDFLKEIEAAVIHIEKKQNWVTEQYQEMSAAMNFKNSTFEEKTNERLDKLTKDLEAKASSQHLAERMSEEEKARESRITEIEKELKPRVQALDHSFQDLVEKNAELIKTTLPKWQAETHREVNDLAREFEKLRKDMASRDTEVEGKLSKLVSHDFLDKVLKALDARLNSELESMKSMVSSCDNRARSLEKDLSAAAAKWKADDQVLSTHFTSEINHLKVSIAAQASAEKTLKASMQDLEYALKQETLDRQVHQKKMSKDIEDLKAALETHRQEQAKAVGSVKEAMMQHSSSGDSRLSAQISAMASKQEITDATARLARTEEQLSSLQKSITSSNERMSSTTTNLLEKFQVQQSIVEKVTKEHEEAKSARGNIKEEQQQKINHLEDSMRKLQKQESERRGFTDSIQKEIQVLRDAMEGSKQANIALTDEALQAVVTKIQPVKTAVENLSQDVDELTRMQEQVEGGIVKLEDQVTGMQQKSGPIDDAQRRLLELEWYLSAERTVPAARAGNDCISCGRRSPPTRSVSPGATQWRSAVRSGGDISNNASPNVVSPGYTYPQPPHTARESGRKAGQTQRLIRVGGGFEYNTSTDEGDQDLNNRLSAVNHPVGPGLSAARFQRTPPSSDHPPWWPAAGTDQQRSAF